MADVTQEVFNTATWLAIISWCAYNNYKHWSLQRKLEDSAGLAERSLAESVKTTDATGKNITQGSAPASVIHRCVSCGHKGGCVFIPAQCTHCINFRAVTDPTTGNEVKEN